MEKTLLEATCKMGKLREIQQTQAAEANPSAGAGKTWEQETKTKEL